MNNKSYIISSNLNVRYLGNKITKTEYNNTILDGELIFLNKKKKIQRKGKK